MPPIIYIYPPIAVGVQTIHHNCCLQNFHWNRHAPIFSGMMWCMPVLHHPLQWAVNHNLRQCWDVWEWWAWTCISSSSAESITLMLYHKAFFSEIAVMNFCALFIPMHSAGYTELVEKQNKEFCLGSSSTGSARDIPWERLLEHFKRLGYLICFYVHHYSVT